MIAIVSYGLGNVRAFASIYERLGIPVTIATSADDLRRATHLIVPGVGSFDWAVQKLAASGLRDSLCELVLEKERPVLGVCVGMQMMVAHSEEGRLPGLGWIDGEVRRLECPSNQIRLALPHMGWNDVVATRDILFTGLDQEPRFYFLHSFHVVLKDSSHAIAYTEYGTRFVSAFRCKNICGVQFHPEKSHHWGVQLLRNFATV